MCVVWERQTDPSSHTHRQTDWLTWCYEIYRYTERLSDLVLWGRQTDRLTWCSEIFKILEHSHCVEMSAWNRVEELRRDTLNTYFRRKWRALTQDSWVSDMSSLPPFFLSFFLSETWSLCRPSYPGTHLLGQSGFRFTEIRLSVPPICWD